jgi:hypothetical protein
VLLRAADASPASLLNPTTNLPTAQPSGGDGSAGGRRITHPPSKMGMVRTLDGLEKSMSQNVIVLGGALDGLTCAHTLLSRTRHAKERARVEREPTNRYSVPPNKAGKAALFDASALRKAAEVFHPVPDRTSPHLTAPHLLTSSPPHHLLTATRPLPLPSSPRHSH